MDLKFLSQSDLFVTTYITITRWLLGFHWFLQENKPRINRSVPRNADKYEFSLTNALHITRINQSTKTNLATAMINFTTLSGSDRHQYAQYAITQDDGNACEYDAYDHDHDHCRDNELLATTRNNTSCPEGLTSKSRSARLPLISEATHKNTEERSRPSLFDLIDEDFVISNIPHMFQHTFFF